MEQTQLNIYLEIAAASVHPQLLLNIEDTFRAASSLMTHCKTMLLNTHHIRLTPPRISIIPAPVPMLVASATQPAYTPILSFAWWPHPLRRASSQPPQSFSPHTPSHRPPKTSFTLSGTVRKLFTFALEDAKSMDETQQKQL